MTMYTYSQARQNFASILNKAKEEGQVLIKRKDGSVFVLTPYDNNDSPFDVKSLDLNLSKKEIKSIIQEIRQR